VTTGYFSIQGYQLNTSTSQRTNLGPFNVPFSGVTDITELTLPTGTTTIGVPGGSNGVAIIPPIGSPPVGVTMKFKTVSGDSGTFISTAEPFLMQWDVTTPNVPANIYLVVAGGSILTVIQFL
jgi:hypothetical protein